MAKSTRRPPSGTPDAFTAGVEDDEIEDVTVQLPPEILEEPELPGFAMADDPIPPPKPAVDLTPEAGGSPMAGGATPYTQGAHSPSPLMPETAIGGEQPSYIDTINGLAARNRATRVPDTGLVGEILDPVGNRGNVTYESRIRILDAWQYTGQVADAPDWVDRNWIGWADADQVRRMDASPCLRVPLGDQPNDPVVICRPGDYVVVQSTVFDDGETTRDEIEVWEREQFQRLFLAKPKAHAPGSAIADVLTSTQPH